MEFKITIPNGFTEFYSLRSPQQHPKLVEGLLMWSFFGAKKGDTRMPKCLLLVIIFWWLRNQTVESLPAIWWLCCGGDSRWYPSVIMCFISVSTGLLLTRGHWSCSHWLLAPMAWFQPYLLVLMTCLDMRSFPSVWHVKRCQKALSYHFGKLWTVI